MAAVWFRFRAELRERWRAWLVLALIVGVVGGVVLGALAGARRTDHAYPDFVEAQHAYDVMVVSGRPPVFPSATFDLDELATLPMVDEAARIGVPAFVGVGPDGQRLDFDTMVPVVPTEGGFGTVMNRLHLLEGRSPTRPNEITPSFVVAQQLNLEVGDRVDGSFLTQAQLAVLFGTFQVPDEGEANRVQLRVVGIEASPGEFPPISETSSNEGIVHFAPSLADSPDLALAVEGLAVRLDRGTADVGAFKRELERRSGGRSIFLRTQVATSTATQRAIGVQSDALRLVALLGALAGALLVGQGLLRQARAHGDEPVLRALGMARSQLLGVAVARVAVVGAVGSVVAAVAAVALSPLTPVGIARNAEVERGLEVDGLVIGVGVIAILLAVVVCGLPSFVGILRAAGRPPSASDSGGAVRPSRLTEAVARLGISPVGVNGVRFALVTSGGTNAAPVRSTIAGVALAVAVLGGVAGFSASLDRLLDQPRLYGWNWHAQLGDPFSPDAGEEVARDLARRSDIGAVSYGSILQASISGRRIEVLAITPVKGGLAPVLAEGRAPLFDDELVLGSKSLAAIDAALGDNVTVEFGSRSREMQIVGKAVLPDIGETGGLGHGAAMTQDAARRIAPNAAANIVLVRAASDRDAPEVVASLGAITQGGIDELGGPYTPTRPVDLDNIRRTDSMPFVIGLGTALIAVATIAHGLASSVRRRRRDLAILKTLGLGRRQIVQVVLWQATTIAVVGLVVGIPLGIVAGRLTWSLVANQLGVLNEPAVSVLALALLVPAVVAVANLAAMVPGRMAGRMRPATILRGE